MIVRVDGGTPKRKDGGFGSGISHGTSGGIPRFFFLEGTLRDPPPPGLPQQGPSKRRSEIFGITILLAIGIPKQNNGMPITPPI